MRPLTKNVHSVLFISEGFLPVELHDVRHAFGYHFLTPLFFTQYKTLEYIIQYPCLNMARDFSAFFFREKRKERRMSRRLEYFLRDTRILGVKGVACIR